MTTLYIKTHNVTGLKYFGKTIQDDCSKYKGSGLHWARHIKKHGYDVQTEIYAKFDETDPEQKLLLVETALLFSEENNIVESKEWANKKPENGLDGGWVKGVAKKPFTQEHKNNIREARLGASTSEEAKKNISASLKGMTKPPRTREHREKLGEAHIGKKLSEEHINILRLRNSGSNSSAAKKIDIYDAEDNLVFSCNGDFGKICKNEDLPMTALKTSYNNNGSRLYIGTKNVNICKTRLNDNYKLYYYFKYRGWYAKIERGRINKFGNAFL